MYITALKRFRIVSNLFDSQRVGTPIINEWTGVAVLCCHGKKYFLYSYIKSVMGKYHSKFLMLFNLAYLMKCKYTNIYNNFSLNVVTTRPFSLRNNLVCRRCTNWTNYCNIKVTWQNIAAWCVSCGESKSKFYNLRGKKWALNEIESIINSLMNSNLDLNPLKRRNIYPRSNFRRTRLFLRANDRVVTNEQFLSS